MSPVFSQEFAPDTQSQVSALLPLQGVAANLGTNKRVRNSFTALSLALSLGAVGSLVSSAEAADSMQLAALPSVAGGSSTLPSFGSARPEGSPASFHTVTDGETIWGIAEQHGLTVEAIRVANGMAEDQVIQVGQVLKVPAFEAPNVDLQAYSASSLHPAPTVAVIEQLDQASELTVAALPDAIAPTTAINDLQFGIPQSAPAAIAPHESGQPAELGADDIEPSSANTVEFDTEGASNQASLSKTDFLRTSKPLASLPGAQPQAESVQLFAEQLGTTEEASVSRKANTETAVNSSGNPADSFNHRVGSGETIWSIALSYGLDPDSLQQLNQVDDSRRLMPGDELVIPAAEVILPDSPEVQRSPYHQSHSAQQLAESAPIVAARPPATNAVDLTKIQIGRADSPAVLENGDVEVKPSEVEADPFVANLLSQTAATSQVVASSALNSTSDVPAADSLRDSDRLAAALGNADTSEEVALNPQFVNSTDAEAIDVEAGSDVDNLLAAAPLGSEVYSPIVENPTGRVVTPEMPVLPGQDAYLPEAPNRFDGFMWPAQGVLTSGYGWRWGRMHRGVDIAGPVGTPIYAAAPGVVVSSGWNSGGYGNLVDIRHADGSMTRYAHNSRLMVRSGQQVRQGQQIAEMGSTGFSTGPHLHFEIHIPNQGTVNPIAMLPNR